MGSNHKISKRKKKEKAHRIGYRLQLGSKDMFSDLIQLGFMPNKSLILHFPKVPGIYLGDFVRGYFDGDGCVYFKKHWVKDRKKMKWVFTTRFTSGSESFLKDLFIHLKKFGLNGGFIVTKYHNSGYELVYSHKDSLALFQSMYHNVTHNLFLPRKYKLFKKAVQILFNKS